MSLLRRRGTWQVSALADARKALQNLKLDLVPSQMFLLLVPHVELMLYRAAMRVLLC